jgi:RHS repeat-associated protein
MVMTHCSTCSSAQRPIVLAEFYYYRARWYDPQAKRFTTEDPIGLDGGINLYAYVGNNPINLTDPLGLEPQDVSEKDLEEILGKNWREKAAEAMKKLEEENKKREKAEQAEDRKKRLEGYSKCIEEGNARVAAQHKITISALPNKETVVGGVVLGTLTAGIAKRCKSPIGWAILAGILFAADPFKESIGSSILESEIVKENCAEEWFGTFPQPEL